MKNFLDQYLALIKKILPHKEAAGSSVGLDIGGASCKMVEIIRSGHSFEIINWSIEKIENGDVGKAIRNILAKVKKPTKRPLTAVFGKGTLIRSIFMPKMPLEDLKKSLSIEADKYFPFAKDQIYTDCYILQQEGPDKKMPVLVAAAKREIIDARVKFLGELGLQTDFVTLNSIALANIIYTFGLGETAIPKNSAEVNTSAFAVLDIGDTVSNLMIMLGNSPRFTRDIFIGGDDLNKRISLALNISIPEAEQLKDNPKDKKEEIFNACDSPLTNLISEMRLSFDYFTTEHGFHIQKLYLTGGGSILEGIVDYFAKSLDMKVESLDPLHSLKVAADVPEGLDKKKSRLGVALGLALCQL